MEVSMFISRIKSMYRSVCLLACACCACSSKAIFGFKTDLNLNGLDVVKESAEILAKTVETFPTKQMAIAIIGFIAFSQGIFFFIKGLAAFICGNTYRPDGKRAGSLYGLMLCLIGLGMAICGALAAIYCFKVSHYLFQ